MGLISHRLMGFSRLVMTKPILYEQLSELIVGVTIVDEREIRSSPFEMNGHVSL